MAGRLKVPSEVQPQYRYSSIFDTLYNPGLTAFHQPVATGRVLALDVGKKRIGLAVSDELRMTAQGLDTLQRTRIREDLHKIKDTIAQWNITLLLVGRPLHMSGSESRQSEYTAEFAERLSAYVRVPFAYWDERLTSVEANRLLRDAGASLEKRKQSVDRLSAILILEGYLGYLRNASEASSGGLLA